MNNKTFYITTPIYYASGKPHIGHALCTLAADVVARWQRLVGREVFSMVGTDEHGQKIAAKAAESGMEPAQFAEEMSQGFRDLFERMGISHDRFIRTTDEDHIRAAEEIWRRCSAAGDIYKKTYKGLYCVGCETFKTEKDLVDGKCPDHQVAPEWVEDENYFFALSKYAEQVALKIKSGELELIPDARKREILSFIEAGVEDISISRSRERLSWGIPVPDDDSQVMYVWFDALTNYLTGAGWPQENIGNRWPADVHVLGRDILRHHVLLWPAMLMSAGLELPRRVVSHGLTMVSGVKMSKSIGNVVDPYELVEKYGRDATRYIMLSEIRFLEDGDFSWQRADVRYAELANNLGNLLSRVLTLAEKLEMRGVNMDLQDEETAEQQEASFSLFGVDMETFEFREAVQRILSRLDAANELIDREKPWEKIKTDPEAAKRTVAHSYETLRFLTLLITPIMPEIAEKMADQLGQEWSEVLGEGELADRAKWQGGKIGTFKKGEVLFPRLG